MDKSSPTYFKFACVLCSNASKHSVEPLNIAEFPLKMGHPGPKNYKTTNKIHSQELIDKLIMYDAGFNIQIDLTLSKKFLFCQNAIILTCCHSNTFCASKYQPKDSHTWGTNVFSCRRLLSVVIPSPEVAK